MLQFDQTVMQRTPPIFQGFVVVFTKWASVLFTVIGAHPYSVYRSILKQSCHCSASLSHETQSIRKNHGTKQTVYSVFNTLPTRRRSGISRIPRFLQMCRTVKGKQPWYHWKVRSFGYLMGLSLYVKCEPKIGFAVSKKLPFFVFQERSTRAGCYISASSFFIILLLAECLHLF